MAELDEKLLKNLDKTLESMNERLLTLETTLSGVKNGLNKTFDPSIITSFSDAIRGLKTLRLIDAEGATKDIQKVKDKIDELEAKWKGDKPLGKGESFAGIADELARYKALMKDIQKGSEQRAVELANAARKEADAVEAEERRKQKAFQDSVKQQTELARKYAELEKLRSEVFGGRSYGKLSGKEKVQWTEMGSSLEKIKKQMEEIEKLSPGSRAKGESIYKEQEAITRAKRESAEEQKRIAKEEAEYEKLLRQEQIQEERRKAAETKRLAKEEADALSEYIRLYREKTGLLKTVSPLDAKVMRNQPLTEQERGLYDASWNRIYAINDEMAKLRANYVSVLEYEEKIQANGQEQVNTKKVQLAQEQALAKEKERQAKSESKQQTDEAKIQRQADAIVKKRIDLERQVQRIDNDRAIRQQTNSKISQQALDAESRKYEALLQRINQLNNALSKLEGKQAGVTSRAEQRNAPYMNYVAAAEEERKAKAIENSTKKLKEQKNALDSMLPTIQRLASAFGIAFSVRGLAQFGKKLIETRGEFELQQVALRSILQNKQLADEIWDKTMQAALQSPFTAMQLTTYTKQLAAYRIETDKLFETTKRLADVSAGLGVDMQRLILAYGQVKAANYLRASEIRQFTEAGVNILGELSRYFTETRGQMYNTAQVMEMVTKRMVKFEDVEAIFKRMTDQGGIFYNMQYVQSQTVKGQIAKLHDAYDQMLNSIGKANQGTLRTLVGLLNNIVKNWREWKTVLDSIMWPLLITSVYKFGRGLLYANAGAIAMNKNVNALTRAGARLNLTFKKLNATIAANPWMLLVEVLVIAGTAIWNHAKAVREVNKEYDEMNGRMLDTQYRMTSYEKKINENNKILKEGKKGTKEYNEAQSENKKILSELQRDYPDVAEGMTIANDGIIAMTNSMKEYNAQLRLQILLNERAKAGFFEQSLGKDAKQMDEEINKQQTKLAQYTQKAQRHAEIVRNIIASGKFQDNSGYEKWLEQLEKIAAATSIEEYEEALKGYTFNESVKFKSISGGRKITSRRNEVLNEIKDDYKFFGSYLKDMALLSEDFTGEFVLSTEGFIEKNREAIQALLYTVKEDGTVEIGELGYALSKAFLDAASVSQTEEGQQTIIDTLIQQFKDKYGLDIKFGVKKKKGETTPTDPFGDNKNKESASKLISLIKEMRSEYDKLSKSAYGYAKSQDKVRKSYEDSVREILGEAGVGIDYDFTTNEGMIAALEKVKSFVQGSSKYAKDAWKDVQKYIDQLETEIEINAQVKIRENFVKEIEKSFNDYELTLELDKLNISPEAAKNLFPEFDSQTLGELQDAMQEFYQKQGASFDEEDFKVYKQWSDKIDAEILKSRKEKAKQYSKYLEKEYSERAKVEMQYAKDVAFVTANFNGEQQKNILKGIEDKYQKDINELTWKSFKESAFYVEMMDDLSSVPADYMKIMLDKIEELLAHPETLSPRALKEAINARQKIIEAQMDFDQIAVMRGSMSEIRAAANDVGGKTWAQTKKRLDEEQKAQAEKLKGLEEEIRCYEEIQGQLKGLEEHDEAVATANRALPEDVISMLENTDIDTLIKQYSDELDSISVSEEATTSAEKDANAQIQARIEYLQRIIPLLVDYRTALDERSAYQATDAGQSALFAREGGETSSSVGQTITDYKKDAEQVSNRLSTLKKWQKAFTNFNNGFAKFNKNAADMVGRLGALSTAAFDLYEALGGETDAMTEAWKEFGGTIVNTITQALTMIPALVAGFVTAGTTINAAMGIIGLIAEAIQLVLVLITGLSKLHDAGYEKEIENQQKIIDNLQRAYNRLEKEIEKTWDTASYIRTYNEETQNLYEQIEALNKQIAAEESKKNADADKIQGYKDSIQDAEDELEELKQAQIEVFGGIGEEGYRDAAQGFVDAWKSAFLETGDGLQGLQEHFDEFLNDWFVKQATMSIAASNLEPLFRKIDDAVDQYGVGGANVTWQELKEINDLKDVLLAQTNEQLQQLAGVFGLGGEGSLSGLAAGIQGMTEEQANILEAYWNSVRMYSANIDMNVTRIAQILGAGGDNANPMLAQMTLVAQNTNNINTLLQSVTKGGHSEGGSGIKVFVN